MNHYEKLAAILKLDPSILESLDREMAARTGKQDVMKKIAEENEKMATDTLNELDFTNRTSRQVRGVLRKTILRHEDELLDYLDAVEGENELEKAVVLARKIVHVGPGYFLKREYAAEILRKRPPENVLKYLGVSNVDGALKNHDVVEIFTALRFMESDEWMHETFEVAYSAFTAADFEERPIEIKVLGKEWHEVAKQFVAKKHHNVSHLKEFGVIFLNPIQERTPGKFLRDFALLFHYSHEIDFYSKMFKIFAAGPDFSQKFKALLRGDVPETDKLDPGEWMIVQRYLAKINPSDPRLLMPRVNPESLHWRRGEKDIAMFQIPQVQLNLNIWVDLDWVGEIFDIDSPADGKELVSFDLEDNAMTLVSFMEGEDQQSFTYHQMEAMWTRIFSEYVGGDDNMEKMLIENFDKGIIKF